MKKVCISVILFVVLLSIYTTVFGASFSGNAVENLPGATIDTVPGRELVCTEVNVKLYANNDSLTTRQKMMGDNFNSQYENYNYSYLKNLSVVRTSDGYDISPYNDFAGKITIANTYFNRVENKVKSNEKDYELWFIASHAKQVRDKQIAIWEKYSNLNKYTWFKENTSSYWQPQGEELYAAAQVADEFLSEKIYKENEVGTTITYKEEDGYGFTITDNTEYEENNNKKLKVQAVANSDDIIVGPYEIYYDYARYTGDIRLDSKGDIITNKSKKSEGTPYIDIKFSEVIGTYIVDEKGNKIKDVKIVDINGNEKELLPDEPFYIQYNPYYNNSKESGYIPYANLKIDFKYLSGFENMIYNEYYGTNYSIKYEPNHNYNHIHGNEETGYWYDTFYKYTKIEYPNQSKYPREGQNLADIDANEVWKNDYIILDGPSEKEFDLSLKKFISAVNDKEISNRVTVEDTTNLSEKISKNAVYNKKYSAYDVGTKKTFTYTIRIYNEGDIAGKATIVKDHLPEGVYSYQILDDAGYEVSYNSNNRIITFEDKGNVGDIQPFDGTLHYEDIKIKCTLSNSVYNDMTYRQKEYDLSMEQYVDATEVYTGQEITYTLKITNNEDEEVYLQEIKQTLPKGIEFVDDVNEWIVVNNSDGTTEVSKIVCEDIEGNSEREFYIDCKVTAKSGILKTVSEIVSTAQPDINESDWKDYAKVIVNNTEEPYVDLELEQEIVSVNGGGAKTEVSKGDVIKYKITVKNEGTGNASNIKIVDYIPDGMVFIPPISDSEYEELKLIANNEFTENDVQIQNSKWYYNENKNTLEYKYGLNSGNFVYLYCVVTTDDEVDLKNIADIISFEGGVDIDSEPDNVNLDEYLYEKQEDDDDFTVVRTGTENLSDIKITTTEIEDCERYTGEQIEYEISITNNGNSNAEVTIKDVLEGMEFESSNKIVDYNEENKTINATMNIEPGTTVIDIKCRITEENAVIQLVNENDEITTEEIKQYKKEIKHTAYITYADIYDKTKSDWKAEETIGYLETNREEFEMLEDNVIRSDTKYLINKAMIIETSGVDRDMSDWKDSEVIKIRDIITTIIKEGDTDITVKKVWDDEGYENLRPDSITVDLLKITVDDNDEKTAEVLKTVELSEDNGWEKTFENLDSGCTYSVEEKSVDNYDTEISRIGNTFTITNYYNYEPTPTPTPTTPTDDEYDEPKPVTMEIAGNVFEDLATTKDGETDNVLGVEDLNLAGIQVTLYEEDGETLARLYQQYEENPQMLYQEEISDEETKKKYEELKTIMNQRKVIGEEAKIPITTPTPIENYDDKVAGLIENGKVEIRTNPTITDENGGYSFKGLDPNKKYIVKFTYNGLVYEPVQSNDNTDNYNTDIWSVTSKATEKAEDRVALNNKFSEIAAYENNYKVGNNIGLGIGTYNKVYLQTDLENNKIYDGYNIYELITNRICTYIKETNSYPDVINTIYNDIVNQYEGIDQEIRNKLQFIEDCKIDAWTSKYPIYNSDEESLIDYQSRAGYTTDSYFTPDFYNSPNSGISEQIDALNDEIDKVVEEADKINGDEERTGIKGKTVNTVINTEEEYNKVDWKWETDENYEKQLINMIYEKLNFTLYATTNSRYDGYRVATREDEGGYWWYEGDDVTYYIYLNYNSKEDVVSKIVTELLELYANDLNEIYKVVEDASQSTRDKNEIINILKTDDNDSSTVDIGTVKTILGDIVDRVINKAKTNAKTNFSYDINRISLYSGATRKCRKPSNYSQYSLIYTEDDKEDLISAIMNTILGPKDENGNHITMPKIVDIYNKQLKIENIYSYGWYQLIKLYEIDIDQENQKIIVNKIPNTLETIKEHVISTLNNRFDIAENSEEYNTNKTNIGIKFNEHRNDIELKVNDVIDEVIKYYNNIKFIEAEGDTFTDTSNLLYPGQKQIHLGLVKREEFDLTIAKDVYKVDLDINGNHMTYNYNDVALTSAEDWIAEVRESDTFYERNIYASDYNYWNLDGVNDNDKLKVSVTYRIALRNQTSGIIGKVTEIVDYYDKDYTFESISIGDGSGPGDVNNNLWNNGSTYNNYQEKNRNDLNIGFITFEQDGLEIKNGEDKFIYTTFKVNDNNGIIHDGQINLNGIKELNESKQNIVEINGYKTYYEGNTTSYNDTNKSAGTTAGVLDRDSIPGNYVPANNYDVDKKQYYADEDDVGVANGLYILVDYFNQRTIEGTVWEDKAIDTLLSQNIRQGNGSYDEGEKLIQNVKATLMKNPSGDAYNSNNVAYYYKIIETEDVESGNTIHRGEWLPVEIYTDENGKYSLTGFVPGEYEVWFTYDNNSINTDIDGTNYNETRYNGQDFKSTIYENKDGEKWYLQEDNRKSDAKDIWSRREAVNNYSKTLTNDIAEQLVPSDLTKYNTEATTMYARTDMLQIDVEYDKATSESISKVTENTIKDDYSKYVIDNVDFGLVERPRAQLSIQKNIVNAKVVLADGTVLFDAIPDENGKFIATNVGSIPRKLATAYVETKDTEDENITKLKNSTHVSTEQGRITMNMDEELMQGANLQVTYEIEVTNIGEIDYNNTDFYYYGARVSEDGTIITIPDDSNLVTTKVDQIIDYVENNLKFNNTLNNQSINQGWEVKDKDNIGTDNSSEVVLKDTVIQALFNDNDNDNDNVTDDAYNTIVVLTNDTTGKTIKEGETEKEYVAITEKLIPKEVAKSDFILTQLISPDNDNDDLTYRNVLEIIKTTNDVGRRMYFSIAGNHVPVERDDSGDIVETSLRPEGREIDTDDGELITIIPPFGANMQEKPQLAILAISLVTFFGIGVYLIKKKVLK